MILTSRRQHRVLAAMQDTLRKSDPRLVATFTMFTRLTRDEAIPGVERVRPEPVRWVTSALRRGVSRRRPVRGGRAAVSNRGAAAVQGRPPAVIRNRLQTALFIPLMAAALLAIVLLLGWGQARASCPATRAAGSATGGHLTALPGQYAATAACPASQTVVMPGRR